MSSPIDCATDTTRSGLQLTVDDFERLRAASEALWYDGRRIMSDVVIYSDGSRYVPVRAAERYLRVANGWLAHKAQAGRIELYRVLRREPVNGRRCRVTAISVGDLRAVQSELEDMRADGEKIEQPYPHRKSESVIGLVSDDPGERLRQAALDMGLDKYRLDGSLRAPVRAAPPVTRELPRRSFWRSLLSIFGAH